MFPSRYRPFLVVTTLTCSAIALASGCAETSIEVGTPMDFDAAQPPSFTNVDSGTDADASVSRPVELCIATTCPAPFETCGNDYRCNTNLSNDPKNCGECGKECPVGFGYLNMTSACVNGTCEPTCVKELAGNGRAWNFADCNKVLEDGCEINTSTDPNNCGGCGNKCADGVACIDGKCGCEPGYMFCGGECVDVRSNDDHCGACNNACQTPPGADPEPPNMYYGCANSQCGQLKCWDFWGDTWANCDGDLKNGCEVYVGMGGYPLDPDNCGKCGKKCTADQICAVPLGDAYPSCTCENPQHTRCGGLDTYGYVACHDLLNDPENCGTCFNKCASYAANTNGACRKGVCEIECSPGWGDCDDDPNNGCETNLKVSDGHCGACGNRCDTQAGQPCVDGQCAMQECDAGVQPQ
jgi:hypothetical protein